MEANTNSVIEHKLIVLNSKDGDKLNGEYLSHVRFNFRDILKGDEIYFMWVCLLSAEIPCSFIISTSITLHLIIALILLTTL
jgi:hypothetical protein